VPNHLHVRSNPDLSCGQWSMSGATGLLSGVRAIHQVPCHYHEQRRTTTYPIDLTHGRMVCEDCFMDNTGLNPHDILCASCMSTVDDDGYCNCDPDNYADRYEDMNDEPGTAVEPEKEETTDDDPDVPMNSLLFRSLPNRPMRMVSFEQEIGLGGNYIAEQFAEAGFGTPDHMVDYHASHNWERNHVGPKPLVFVEEDASVAAELVWSCMDLDTEAHVKTLESGLEMIRTAIKQKRVKLDMRCGGHIHVDVRDYVPKNAASAYFLGCYLEDTVYRLGSANWKCHRTEVARENYAPIVRKGALETRDALLYAGGDRAWMNFGHLLAARGGRNCGCGASTYGLWDECTCTPRQCTIEFRVFNTTANPIKLRAYIALCVGMIQYAKDHDVRPDKFPAFEWSGKSDNLEIGKSLERLDFIMNKLPMEDTDKKAILYCVKNSSLAPCLEAIERKEN